MYFVKLRYDYTIDQKAESGCIVTVDYSGKIEVHKGLQRKGDFVPEAKDCNEYSQGLQDSLSNQRLAILARSTAKDFELCFDVTLYSLMTQHLRRDGHYLPNIQELNTRSGINGRHEVYDELLPNLPNWWDSEAFLQSTNPIVYIADLAQDQKHELFALCTSVLITDNQRAESETMLDYLAERADIQPEKVWRPTQANFWNRLKKAQILKIGTEVLGQKWADSHEKAKKSELTKEMQSIFAGETVAGIRPDQRVRAEQWLPEAMTFGTMAELPELTEPDDQCRSFVIDLDDTGELACTEVTEPEKQPGQPQFKATISRLIPAKDGGLIVKSRDFDTGEELPSVFMA